MPPGFRRSRALWDEARRPNAPRLALLHAILYELQPVRFSAIDVSGIATSLQTVWSTFVSIVTETVPSLTRGSVHVLRNMNQRHWMAVGAVILYYNVVRWVHRYVNVNYHVGVFVFCLVVLESYSCISACFVRRLLDAGPLLVIVTALVAIFTIGLGDTATRDGVSAYSVFNRGFERILGTVDAEALVQQHVGGAMGLAGAMGAAPAIPPPEVEPIPREAVARRQQQQHDDDEDDDNVARADNQDNDAFETRGTSRKSGKKARRQNLEQKRELQRQREAAIAMGFTGNEGQEEMMAMQRLLEEQIAANNE